MLLCVHYTEDSFPTLCVKHVKSHLAYRQIKTIPFAVLPQIVSSLIFQCKWYGS